MPVTSEVRTMSSPPLSIRISRYASGAALSVAAMKLVPAATMSAPRTRAAARERPLEMPPAKMTGPSKNLRTSDTKEKGFNQPVLPPAPAVSRIKRSEEHTSELQSLMRISYAVFCLKKKKNRPKPTLTRTPRNHNNIKTYRTTNNKYKTQHNNTNTP